MSAVQLQDNGPHSVRMTRAPPGLLRPSSATASNQGTMVVVGADGKTKTVLRIGELAKAQSASSSKEAPAASVANPFQYKVPISKYNTLHNVTKRPLQVQQTTASNESNGRLEKEYNTLKSKEQEEQVELRRLRTENRLLRQRIENLEKETATLADRLIQDQVKHAQQEEEMYALRRQLSVAKQHSTQVNQKLTEVTDQLQINRSQSAPATTGVPSLEFCEVPSARESSTVDKAKDDQIELLQQELVDIRQRDAESTSIVKQLKHKIQELENANSELQTEPSLQLQCLQEELIACKLREAESNLSLKELQQKVIDLEKHYQKFVERSSSIPPTGKAGKHKVEQLQEDLMALRIREANAHAEVKEFKQQVMELQTENHIHDRQIKRMEKEAEKLTTQVDEHQTEKKALEKAIKDFERKMRTHGERSKEDSMMLKIKDAEHSQMIAEMRNRVAELEIENQELITAVELRGKGDKEDYENTITDLKEEILQLKMARRLHSISSLAINNISLDTESDYDTDDIEETLNNSKLNLSDSMIGDSEGNLMPPKRPQLNDLDLNGSWDEDEESSESPSTPDAQRITRKKKRKSRKEIDLDKTPTVDQCNADFALVGEAGGSCDSSLSSSSSLKTSEANCDVSLSPAIVMNNNQ